jgi:myxalamid-type polyketide synthase MxaE and MxaD
MLAVDGSCKTFDARADGFVRGEGCGIIVLKRQSLAQEAEDRILALVRGSAVNQDGHSNGLTAPNLLSQQEVLRQALQNAGVRPEEVGYIETHGTGTPLGDPIEVAALTEVYGQNHQTGSIVLGAVKTNIGHLEAASGIASVIKTILILQQQAFPPNLHFQTLNPNISFENTCFVLPERLLPWTSSDASRYAAISSFGFGGTNAHAILEESPCSPPASIEDGEQINHQMYLLPLSAQSLQSLRMLAIRYRDLLIQEEHVHIQDLCYSAGAKRVHHALRLAVRGKSGAELQAGLTAYLAGEIHAGMFSGQTEAQSQPPLVFVFPGQGSQWIGMGQQLLAQEPSFRATIERCEQAMRPYVTWSLLAELQNSSEDSPQPINVIQPVLFALQVALVALWQSWGITASAVIGHSMGEVAAAYVAGALNLDEACKIICLRSKLLRRVSGRGAKAVVELSLEQAQNILEGYEHTVSLAASNSPRSTVLAGDAAALEQILHKLEQQQIFCRRIKVDVASHSPQMDILQSDLLATLAPIHPRQALIPIYSTVMGKIITGTELEANYWVQNLRQPVLFSTTTQNLIAEGYAHFLEMSAHPILTSSIEEGLHTAGKEGYTFSSLRRNIDEKEALIQTLAALYTRGYAPDWHALYPASHFTSLPRYPWHHERFWVEKREPGRPQRDKGQQMLSNTAHPLLGTHIAPASQPGTHYWEMSLGRDDVPYLQDHQVQDHVILPAAAYVEMVLAASKVVFSKEEYVLETITFSRMLRFVENKRRKLQVVLTVISPIRATIHIFSDQDTPFEQPEWILHANAVICFHEEAAFDASLAEPPPPLIQKRVLSHKQVYQRLQEKSLTYGPCFQGIQQAEQDEERVFAQLQYPQEIAAEVSRYHIHPAILDACFQTLAIIPVAQTETGPATYIPIGIEHFRLFIASAHIQMPLYAYAHLPLKSVAASTDLPMALEGTLQLFDAKGTLVLAAQKLHLQRLETNKPSLQENLWDKWCYELLWHPQKRAVLHQSKKISSDATQGKWLIFVNRSTNGQKLKSYLESYGQMCVQVWIGATYAAIARDQYSIHPTMATDFQRLLKDVYTHENVHCCGIVHLWSMEEFYAQEPLVNVNKIQELGCGSALLLVQALVQAGWRDLPRLWLITQGSQFVHPQTCAFSSIAQAPLWGLGRSIPFEYPGFHCSLVDIDLTEDGQEQEYPHLAEEVLINGPEDQIALRGHRRYVARLVPSSLKRSAQSAAQEATSPQGTLLNPASTYLISGGLGGLGLTLAQWMVSQGVRHLVLIGRSAPSAQALEVLASLQETGAQVKVAHIDIAQEEPVAHLLQEIAQSAWPLRGIIHAAGILDDGTLLHLNLQRFKHVMAPKIAGSWHLHRLTLQQKLDFFVLFSSAASLLGSPGQGNYAAANAFLDALAHYRHSIGLPALSLNWGPWAEVGLAARPDREGRLAFQGINSIKPVEGVAIVEQALKSDQAQVAVMPFNTRRWRQFYPKAAQAPFLQQLMQEDDSAISRNEGHATLRTELLTVQPGPERHAIFEAFLLQHVALVLRCPVATIDRHAPFNTLNMDSMMAIELRNRIESDLKLTLPATLIWTYPTIAALSSHLSEELGIPLDSVEEMPRLPSSAGEFDKMGHYSEEELLQLLAKELSSEETRKAK